MISRNVLRLGIVMVFRLWVWGLGFRCLGCGLGVEVDCLNRTCAHCALVCDAITGLVCRLYRLLLVHLGSQTLTLNP